MTSCFFQLGTNEESNETSLSQGSNLQSGNILFVDDQYQLNLVSGVAGISGTQSASLFNCGLVNDWAIWFERGFKVIGKCQIELSNLASLFFLTSSYAQMTFCLLEINWRLQKK